MTDVVTCGEAMGALRGPGPLRLGGDLRLSVAGAEANVAIGLARLGHAVRWVGRVGDDEVGRLVQRTLRAEAVHTDAVTVDPSRPTGLMLREQRIGTLTRVSYYRSGSAGGRLTPADVLPWLPDARIVHLTGITAALGEHGLDTVRTAAKAAHDAGATVCLDVNHRALLWDGATAGAALRPVLADVDVLIASEDELALVEAAVQERHTVVVKRGALGARVHSGGAVHEAAALQVPVRDVVGAGDAFTAGYLSGLLDGADVPGCLDRAVRVAAFAIAQDGDWEGLPTRSELDLLDNDPGATIR